jgi:threonyl-tRNA synthetase
VQAVVIPVAERHRDYGYKVADQLRSAGVRLTVDDRNEKMNYKIREAQVQKVPYMLVVGDKEVEAKTVSVRHRQAGDLGSMAAGDVGDRIARLARERAIVEEPPRVAAPGGVS